MEPAKAVEMVFAVVTSRGDASRAPSATRVEPRKDPSDFGRVLARMGDDEARTSGSRQGRDGAAPGEATDARRTASEPEARDGSVPTEPGNSVPSATGQQEGSGPEVLRAGGDRATGAPGVASDDPPSETDSAPGPDPAAIAGAVVEPVPPPAVAIPGGPVAALFWVEPVAAPTPAVRAAAETVATGLQAAVPEPAGTVAPGVPRVDGSVVPAATAVQPRPGEGQSGDAAVAALAPSTGDFRPERAVQPVTAALPRAGAPTADGALPGPAPVPKPDVAVTGTVLVAALPAGRVPEVTGPAGQIAADLAETPAALAGGQNAGPGGQPFATAPAAPPDAPRGGQPLAVPAGTPGVALPTDPQAKPVPAPSGPTGSSADPQEAALAPIVGRTPAIPSARPPASNPLGKAEQAGPVAVVPQAPAGAEVASPTALPAPQLLPGPDREPAPTLPVTVGATLPQPVAQAVAAAANQPVLPAGIASLPVLPPTETAGITPETSPQPAPATPVSVQAAPHLSAVSAYQSLAATPLAGTAAAAPVPAAIPLATTPAASASGRTARPAREVEALPPAASGPGAATPPAQPAATGLLQPPLQARDPIPAKRDPEEDAGSGSLPSLGSVPGGDARVARGAAEALPLRGDTGTRVADQVAQALVRADGDRIEIALDPEELGSVRLRLSPDGVGMLVAVQADRSDTLDLLRRHVAQLEQDLRDAGYASVAFSFGSDPRGQGSQAAPTYRPDWADGYGSPSDAAVTSAPARAVAARVSGGTGLDLRL